MVGEKPGIRKDTNMTYIVKRILKSGSLIIQYEVWESGVWDTLENRQLLNRLDFIKLVIRNENRVKTRDSNNKESVVIVFLSSDNHVYIKTQKDEITGDNLGNLPPIE